jgi:hypothetical protein
MTYIYDLFLKLKKSKNDIYLLNSFTRSYIYDLFLKLKKSKNDIYL